MGAIYVDGVCYSAGGGGGGGPTSADQVSLDDTNLAYVADDVQEAFEKVTKSLTYAEYEALTEEEKNNGTIYLITDVNGDGQSFQPVIYSTEEREVGVWTDGKPLYQKTFEVPYATYPSSWVELADLTSLNIDTIFQYDSYTSVPSMSDGKYSAFNTLYYENTKKLMVLQLISSSSYACSGSVTVRYTKTTDTAGSGTWTPQGVPAVHYSTEEQVIGTWVDGSTLYEKTIQFQSAISLSANTWTNVIDVSALNINNLVSSTAQASNSLSVMSPYAQITNGTLQAFLPFNWYISSVTIRYTKSST